LVPLFQRAEYVYRWATQSCFVPPWWHWCPKTQH